MKFGDNLKKLRKSKNMSQEDLAAKVNVSRQSVSKWENSEAYPEMNNILELCKIFKCSITDLINDNIVDIDSLDEEVKMSVVKLKKEKQKKVKALSKILSVIGKIGGIVAKVAIVFVILAMIAIPMVFKDVQVQNGEFVSSGNHVKVVKNENETELITKNNTKILVMSNREMSGLVDAIENNSKEVVVGFLEAGFAVLLVFLIVVIQLLKHLELLFDNINKGDTPFTLENVTHIKKMTYLLIACILLSGLGSTLTSHAINEYAETEFGISDIVEILFLYSLSYIFEYGYEIQLDSKGKMYDE